MNNLYPIFIKLQNKACVVIGGGSVAYRKIQVLLDAGAHITLISPDVSDKMNQVIQNEKIKYLNRNFQSGDLAHAFLVIAATDDSEVNKQIWQEANENNVLVNVVDVPDLCNFYVPSVVRDGDLALAISTNGKAPYLSKMLRLMLTDYLTQFNFKDIIKKIDHKKNQLKIQFPGDIKIREKEIKTFINNLLNQY